MTDQELKECLQNAPLVDAIRAKKKVDRAKDSLYAVLTTLEQCKCSDSTKQEIQDAAERYKSISLNYRNLLQDAFGVTWPMERRLNVHVLHENGELDG